MPRSQKTNVTTKPTVKLSARKVEKDAARKAAKKVDRATKPPKPPKVRVVKARDPVTLERAMRAVGAAIDKKALEPVLSYIGELTSYADYVLIVSGRSDRQVQAIAEGIALASKQAGVVPLGVESTKDGRWTLIDLGDVIVHVFHHPVRDYYDLEGLWGDAPRVKLTIPADCRARPEDAYTT